MVRLEWHLFFHGLLTHSKKPDQKGNLAPIDWLGPDNCALWDCSSHPTAKLPNKIIPQACHPLSRRFHGAIVGF